jgi:outer membrane lipoprotein carrier protein
MNSFGRLLAVLALCLTQAVVAADTTQTALDLYLKDLKTWSAQFNQTIVDARNKRIGSGRGRLVIVRPGKFRWESAPANAGDAVQLLIADGQNLWFYDRDLEQATVKPLAQALTQSPAMLLAGNADLRAAFSVQANGKRAGLDWVRVVARDPQSDFREVLFGFKARELSQLVVTDKLDQRTTLEFSGIARNRPVDAAQISFVVPKGVDLIGTPLSP